MPYEGEFAQYKPLGRLVKSERVKNLLGSYEIRSKSEQVESLQTLNLINIQPGDWIPQKLIAIDGSHAEVEIENGFPGAEASYVTVASVILDVKKMKELDRHRPVEPKQFRTIEKAESIDCALPGCNVVYKGEKSANSSLRKSIFEVFGSVRMLSDGESLLDTYEALLKYKPLTEQSQKCPYEDCLEDRDYQRGNGQYTCPCNLSRPLYSTDALRIYERMNPAGTNGGIFGEIMQVLETVWMVHILRSLEAKKWLSSLGRLAIILDGQLAVFGQPAWISQAVYQELSRINGVAKEATGGKDILIIGIEKTGTFVEHFEDLDRKEDGSLGNIPCQSVGLLTDLYIKQNIIFSDSTKPYGAATYFGRKFFYKTKSGARIVATLPFLAKEHRDLTTAEPSQFPRLSDAVGLLDQLVSSRFPNALVPLVSANAEAAIPLRLGNKVLEKLAKELMAEN
ncbi:DNA double-strand break repair nuclease NurA [Argonema galeatum]|uniref:DNA double-strand break repair nuclease NurA n=1 Tax=Argonema galeatum TaxID=2942762 RepID=UPI0020120043|nr:DNA double-strand break repair nuclease NurA [Argonema galeatum]MCL1465325.1 DNA double-strand break repair nuclease NurA [Argonema galeatum A003/A1]